MAEGTMAMNSALNATEEHYGNDTKTPEDLTGAKGEDKDQVVTGTEVKATKNGKSWDEKIQSFKMFLWNPEKREFLGRTSRSWCVMIKPYFGGFTIAFNSSEESTWSHYVKSLHQFLESYNDSIQAVNNIPCSPGQYFVQKKDESEERLACQFNRTMLKNCSGIEDPTFGYSAGKPCIFLKMNRIIGYLPGKGTTPYVTCEFLKEKKNSATIHFYPNNGTFDLTYFPYYGKLTHVNYSIPIVAMQYENMKKNSAVSIQCKVNGPGIQNDIFEDRFSGRIVFTLNIQE
ncbi:protein ATP1B4-like isoform X3 [Chiloscyllium plagiosum]|uniref:protein ATP1B4-like isoform X3 n=1 Tax=Chiloscyllium plagiosum TaxID=36176 RepID=UPI001CB7E5C9|nr:protein ATP1B4-like isoform X3 [Chiloscyllium plagiosum]